MPFDCHFAQRSEGRPAQSAPLMQVPATVRKASRNLKNWMVRAVGIEPTLLAELDFESGATTVTNPRNPTFLIFEFWRNKPGKVIRADLCKVLCK